MIIICNIYKKNNLLTDATGCKYSRSIIWWSTIWKHWLQHINAESQGYDGLTTRPHYHTLNPESDEREERSESLHNICVIGA